MKPIYKTITSILVILILTTASVAINVAKTDDKRDANEFKELPVPSDAAKDASYATTYTDMWTYLDWNTTWTNRDSNNKWVDLDGMTQKINLKYPSTLVVLFSSRVAGYVYMRILLDGSELGPGPMMFSDDISDISTNIAIRGRYPYTVAFNFRREWVSAGTHTIKVQAQGYCSFDSMCDIPVDDGGGGIFGVYFAKSMIVIANGYGH